MTRLDFPARFFPATFLLLILISGVFLFVSIFSSKMTFAKPRATYKNITQLPASAPRTERSAPSWGEPQTTHNKLEELSEALPAQ